MKREARGHTKMKRLCRKLDIPLYQAMGILECLWHLAAVEAWRGDIGKLSNEDIALGLDYRGDENKLIDALVDTGWLEEDKAHRLVVHDWQEHADDAVKKRVQRAISLGQKGFCREMSGQNGKMSGHVATNGQNGSLPEPVPVPVPGTEPVPVVPDKTPSSGKGITLVSSNWEEEIRAAASKCAESIHGRHPGQRRNTSANACTKSLLTILNNRSLFTKSKAAEACAFLSALDLRHQRLCASLQWTQDGGEYAKGLENWLAPTMDRYMQEPTQAARGQPTQQFIPLPPAKPLDQEFPR